ncbi:MAG: methylated-DNA--[protein]-cysteine S-methyltransferase [Deltaproteobacteria bacterium]|nr:methylated-DNA--[protein]-cysteine S-methyltransferase [Deltaproteobacteria bacterium]
MNCYWDLMDSPCGPLLLVVDEAGAVVRIDFPKGRSAQKIRLDAEQEDDLEEAPDRLAHLRLQLDEYFAGDRTAFELELNAQGTPFQKSVWDRLVQIPYGETTSYGILSQQIGNPSASRAVGGANGANPISIVVPCHRVVGSNGSLTGFGGGLEAKRLLLDLEASQSGGVGSQMELTLKHSER